MTGTELRVWIRLRGRKLDGWKFRRQQPIGPYYVDFYCPAARLAVEVDGLAHDTAAQARHDERRRAWLTQQGVRVLRIRASDVLKDEELEGVLLGIERAATPSGSLRSPPPPHGGGGTRRL